MCMWVVAACAPVKLLSVAAPQVAWAAVPEPIVAPHVLGAAEFAIDASLGHRAAGTCARAWGDRLGGDSVAVANVDSEQVMGG